MNLENMIMLDQEERILFIGERVFSFLSSKKSYPLGSAAGKLEVGDLLLYFAKQRKDSVDEIEQIKEKCPFVSEEEGMLMVCCLERRELLPLVKSIPRDLPKQAVLLDTMYESNEIVVEQKDGILKVSLNAQSVSFPLVETESMYIIAKEGKIHAFGSSGARENLGLLAILSERKYPAWLKEGAVLGQKADKVLSDELCKALRECGGEEEKYFTVGAATYIIKKAKKSLQNGACMMIAVQDAEDILQEMSEASAAYKKILRNVPQGILPQGNYNAFRLLGDDDKVKEVTRLLQKSSVTNTTILLTGESGTGKTFIAGEIHKASRRSNGPFIHVNCAAIPYNLMESELFGYAEGAFTGARKGGKSGYFEQAHGGTLFLDEISEMNIHLQTRLLRVLQEKEITRIGGDSVINVDVRIIAASNIKLKTLVNQSAFRKDLYYRLNVLSIQIPTLDERRDDIPILVEKMKEGLHAGFSLTQDAIELLQNVHFEGNIRELQNLVERLNYSDRQIIDADELKRYLDQDVFGTDSASLQDIEIIERFIKENSHQADRILPVLSVLQATYRSSRKLGRKTVLLELEKSGIYLSEQEIRTIFQILAFYRLIRITRGRGGTCITDLGIKAYYYIMEKGAAQTESPQ